MLFHFMHMGDQSAKNQLCSAFCFARLVLLCVAVLIPSLVFIFFLSFEVFHFLVTIPILILSTILVLKTTKKKVILVEKPVGNHLCGQDDLPEEEVREQLVQEVLLENEKEVGDELHSAVETEKEVVEGLNQLVETVKQTAQQSENSTIYDYQVELFDGPSDAEFSDESVPSENFDLMNWMCTNNVGQTVKTSVGSVSDEDDDDSLIEIKLPGSESGGLEEEPKEKLQTSLPDFLPESIFREQGPRELLADINEMNEEENLIEIDISMGSIKCPRFEIKA